nr:competence type IV pilus minor pilin ComGE [Bacillus clarus]
MKCQKGLVMIEMLVALSLLMMAVSLLLPQTLRMMQERRNIQLHYKAHVLLKKEVAIYTYQNEQKSSKEEIVDGVIYDMYWMEGKICTTWRNMKQQKLEKCRYANK